MALFDDFETMFTAAAYFSTVKSAEMDEREETLKFIGSTLDLWLPAELSVGDESTSLRVEIGGRHGGVSPVPWVRVFSPTYSPRATEGFYLVYLFAGDGSRVYLSLNQGTSEFRSSAMRPINDEQLLLARAAAARQLFDGWSPDLMQGLTPTIDLAVTGLPVGAESKRRSRNYELANVYALPYEADTRLEDEVLRSDLMRMLPFLSSVYARPDSAEDYSVDGSVLVPTQSESPSGKPSGQKWVSDSRLKKAIEDYSMAFVIWLCVETGEWDVEDVSKYRSYDVHLRRKNDKLDIHVEVKGTKSAGETVYLTENEVKNAQTYEHTILAIVHNIKVSFEHDEIVCSGGDLKVLNPWTPANDDLTAKQYEYRVPKKS